MKIHLDERADALYLSLDDGAIAVAESEEVAPGIVLDYDDRDRVVGVEVLDVTARAPIAGLRRIQFEVA